MIVERLKKEDLNELIELYKELLDCENEHCVCDEILEKMNNDENYYLLVAKENDKIIGTVLGIVCYSIPMSGMSFMVVEDVIVKEEFRQKGVGRMLFDEIDRISLERNCAYSMLVSSAHRTEAHKFYDSMGYSDPALGFRKKYI